MAVQRLYIVAGPNGSGKSLFSRILAVTDYEVLMAMNTIVSKQYKNKLGLNKKLEILYI
ncbi:hypothetical protein [Hufsiella ginkgonis]|uniref:Uncharacterized protein n=1 Tax=Hufsiella ginkgonis TaxID=2695274 RepID=A0A7K1XZU0_9SPHI|nr:hypothetical protein [Hufsiella ginkgonis]MXV16531.1 hypothetical protein [Hufsiella ginkgonis]